MKTIFNYTKRAQHPYRQRQRQRQREQAVRTVTF